MATSGLFLNYTSDSDIWAVLEVSKLPAGVEATNNVSGTNTANGASVTVVRAPNGSLLPPPGYAVDVYDLFIEYPIDYNGSYPDVELRFQIGEVDVSRIVISGGYTRNMFPRADRVYGGPGAVVPLAESMRKLYNQLVKGQKVVNLPLRITGLHIPAQQPLSVIFKSNSGFGVGGTPIRPLRVYLKGDMWTDEELAHFQTLFTGSFGVRRHPDGTVTGTFVLPSGLTSKTVGMLPNGTTQQAQAVQIYRKLAYAVNTNPITTAAAYIYSTQPAVGGQQQNVSDARHDLGFPYSNTNKAFIPYEFGLRFASSLIGQGTNPEIYVGWWNAAARAMVPDMHANGLLVSAQRNPIQYGAVLPQVDAGNEEFPLPSASKVLSMLVNKADWAPAVSAIGLSAFAANSIYLMVGGIEVIGV